MLRIIRTLGLASYFTVALAMAVTITLSPQQLADIAAQQGGATPAPSPTPTPAPAPVPGADTADHCAGFDRTVHLKVDWNAPARLFASVGANDIIVYEFTTGSGKSLDGNLPRVAGAEYGGGAANRIVAMSEKPCNFDAVGGAVAASQNSSAPTIPFTVQNPYPWIPGYYPDLKFNATYFVNIKVAPGSGCTTSCNMFLDLSKNGTP